MKQQLESNPEHALFSPTNYRTQLHSDVVQYVALKIKTTVSRNCFPLLAT